MSNASDSKKHGHAVQTTGHAWDGDLQEYNNPLPTWWIWSFYATVVFAVVYWILFPAWPLGTSFTKGMFNEISYEVGGQTKTSHWNTRALLLNDMQFGEGAVKQQKYLKEILASSYDQILSDADKLAFTRSYAKGLFGDNCAACHGSGANGVVGLFPNLVDDAWLWGGSTADIENTIRNGHIGFMPAFAETFDEAQLDALAEYVLSLSEKQPEQAKDFSQAKVAEGQRIFQGQEGGCYYCHGTQATGLKSQGAANLTDSIWTVADVPGAASVGAKKAAIKSVIHNGIKREMPAWLGRLSDGEIKLLTAYVYSLSGGQ